MKSFAKVRREAPNDRRRYGKPETKKEALLRLEKDRELKNKRKELLKEIKAKNKEEFHFEYHSVDKSMVKQIKLSKDELKKTFLYVNAEIKRTRRNLESFVKKCKNVKVIYKEDGEEVKVLRENNEKSELEVYLEKLFLKRDELVDLMGKL